MDAELLPDVGMKTPWNQPVPEKYRMPEEQLRLFRSICDRLAMPQTIEDVMFAVRWDKDCEKWLERFRNEHRY